MKKTFIGSIMILSATLADVGILISSAILSTALLEWNSGAGKLWTALVENGMLFPFILVKVIFCIGIVIVLKEYFKKAE